jgi:S1-C subfamily serine protease
MPISTQWTLDAVGEIGRSSVNSVYMIVCTATGSKGSGFLLDNGLIVTNEHVVRGCVESQIIAVLL